MKLINKFTLWFLCITLATTIVGMFITYYTISQKIDTAALERLKTVNMLTAERIRSGTLNDTVVQGRKVAVKQLATPLPADTFKYTAENTFDPLTKKPEYTLTATSFFNINDKSYQVTTYGCVSKSGEILAGLETSTLWKWLLIIFLIAISARLVSRIILSPFNNTLKAIGDFNVKKQEKVALAKTNTKEFTALNNFVQGMTDHAIEEYASLKEFTENASHELQTPVAVIRGKLDLLGESELTDQQALLIADAQSSLEKLSRINSSLILLAKLENNEYPNTEPLRFCRLLNKILDDYSELAEMKMIRLTKQTAKEMYVNLHPDIADLLLTNLISNAIRHNHPSGTIHVDLTVNSLTIKNTGAEPEGPTEELFKRFKKGNQCSQSIGIGLALVKQICETYGYEVSYEYEDGLHILQVIFNKNLPPVTDNYTVANQETIVELVPQAVL